jgi:hypothetical protein
MNTNVAYPVLGVYLILVLGAGLFGAFLTFTAGRRSQDKVRRRLLPVCAESRGRFLWWELAFIKHHLAVGALCGGLAVRALLVLVAA